METSELAGSVVAFVLASTAVWYSGTRLTRFVDELAERKGLDRALLGAFVLATVTQLPEVVTNVTAAYRGDAQLALNGMFGGVSMQTAVLVVADAVAVRYSLTFLARRSSNLVLAALLIGLLALVMSFAQAGDMPFVAHVGIAPVVLAACYGGVIWLTSRVKQTDTWSPTTLAEDTESSGPGSSDSDHDDASLESPERVATTSLVAGSIVASLLILAAGIVLVVAAESIASQTGLGNSFVGVTLLASATSLPEVSTTLTAVRLGQHSMAIADIFGSNLIMVGLLLPTDCFYRQGLLLEQVDSSAALALALGILLTAIYLLGLLLRRPRKWGRLGVDSWVALVAYILGVAALYALR